VGAHGSCLGGHRPNGYTLTYKDGEKTIVVPSDALRQAWELDDADKAERLLRTWLQILSVARYAISRRGA
jgi:hypothetical protein